MLWKEASFLRSQPPTNLRDPSTEWSSVRLETTVGFPEQPVGNRKHVRNGGMRNSRPKTVDVVLAVPLLAITHRI